MIWNALMAGAVVWLFANSKTWGIIVGGMVVGYWLNRDHEKDVDRLQTLFNDGDPNLHYAVSRLTLDAIQRTAGLVILGTCAVLLILITETKA